MITIFKLLKYSRNIKLIFDPKSRYDLKKKKIVRAYNIKVINLDLNKHKYAAKQKFIAALVSPHKPICFSVGFLFSNRFIMFV